MAAHGAKEGKGGDSPAQLLDARVKALGDWRGETLDRVRTLIKQVDPDVFELTACVRDERCIHI